MVSWGAGFVELFRTMREDGKKGEMGKKGKGRERRKGGRTLSFLLPCLCRSPQQPPQNPWVLCLRFLRKWLPKVHFSVRLIVTSRADIVWDLQSLVTTRVLCFFGLSSHCFLVLHVSSEAGDRPPGLRSPKGWAGC